MQSCNKLDGGGNFPPLFIYRESFSYLQKQGKLICVLAPLRVSVSSYSP